LGRCGFHFPTKAGLDIGKSLLGKPRGYKALKKAPKAVLGSAMPTALTWPQVEPRKHKINFLSKEMQAKAKSMGVEALQSNPSGTKAKECKDTKFTGYKVEYETLADKRRRCNVFMFGATSGSKHLAVSGEESKVGSGIYALKKVKTFPVGPALETTKVGEAREWCLKLGAKSDPRAGKERVIRSYGAKLGLKRKASSLAAHSAKKARAAGA